MTSGNAAEIYIWGVKVVLTGAAVVVTLCCFLCWVCRPRRSQASKTAQQARRERDTSVQLCLLSEEQADHESSDREKRIARMSATTLRAAISSKELTCEEVMLAFCTRAHTLGRDVVNCVTEEFYDEAVKQAKAVDARAPIPDVEVTPPLWGLPISLKDVLQQKGAWSTCGMVCRTAERAEEEGLITRLLREAGGIPFVRTNVPQCLMVPESKNAIFGRSDNPWDLKRTVGGSSGGEGGLLAVRGSPLGIGTDIGGSIRIPCLFNGLYGLKPTPHRMTRAGLAVPRLGGRLDGQNMVMATAGPMGTCTEDLELVMRALCTEQMWASDPTVPPIPWDKVACAKGPGRPLRIGVFETDGWFQPCATAVRAVREASQGLRDAGHEVKAFIPPTDGWSVAQLYYGIMGAEGNMKNFVDALEGEPLLPEYKTLHRITNIPNFLRPLISWVLRLTGEYRKSALFGAVRSGGLSARQYLRLGGQLHALKQAWLTAMKEDQLDALVYPGPAVPALLHGGSRELTPAFTYTFLGNLLHWPVGAVPVTTVRAEEESYPLQDLPPRQRDHLARLAQATLRGAAGLPVGVQVMTLPFTDELTIYTMRQLQSAIPFYQVPDLAGL